MRTKNIFYQLVNSENPTTELFCNLFAFKPFRDAVLERLLLPKELIETIEFEHCDTQYSLTKDTGRPDFLISNEFLQIIFEIKIRNPGLTRNQPVGYLEYLLNGSHQHKWLILLAPSDYSYINEWKSKKDKFLEQPHYPGIQTRIISWTDIIKIIEKNDFSTFNSYLKDFLELLKKRFEPEHITFTRPEVHYMFSEEIPKAIIKLFKIVDYVTDQLKLTQDIGDIMVKSTDTLDEYGAYVKNKKDEDILFYGIWYKFWIEHKKPLCFCVSEKYSPSNTVEKFSHLHNGQFIKYGRWLVCWIDQDTLSKDNNMKEIANIIESELKQLNLGTNSMA